MHETYLKQALTLAKSYRGYCAPNPAVGAVLVEEGKIIAEGTHTGPGSSHAEVDAIKRAPQITPSTILYVTLEPCSHQGRTPPCVDAIIHAGIKTVYFAFKDPNPIIAGQSVLNEKGIHCEQVSVDEINDFYRSYAYWTKHKKPFVTAKLAMSMDGKIAGKHSKPVLITGSKTNQFTHELRNKSDAILTSARTIINDDPQMNVRLNQQTHSKPLYILNSNLTLPDSAKIFETAKSVTVFNPDENEPKVCLDLLLTSIGQDGVHDLLIEAGGRCFNQFIKENLVNIAYVYVAKKVLGSDALSAALDAGIFDHATLVDRQIFDEDIVYTFSLLG